MRLATPLEDLTEKEPCIDCGTTLAKRGALRCKPCENERRRRAMPPLKQRLLTQVETVGDCWLWTGAIHPPGYGRISLNGKPIGAHRASYLCFVGPIPAGMYVLHTCDVKRCIKPEHLFLGTHADNMADMSQKGRAQRHRARLDDGKVQEIRRLHTEGVAQMELARRYGVSQGTIWPIIRRKTWAHVG